MWSKRSCLHRHRTRWTTVLGVAAVVAVSVASGGGLAQAEDLPVDSSSPIAGSGSAATGSTAVANGALSGLVPPVLLKALAFAVVPPDQMSSFEQLISHESSWDMFALNPSGAYGLPQALPAEKMGDEGPFWLIDPLTQLRWAYKYMNERYGSPNAAWAFWQANRWY